jgi:hypothetical protein
MRNALVRKLLIVLLFLSIFNADVYGQYKKKMMFVPYRSQQTGKWCWAASIKMIMDFHNPAAASTFTQCDLVKQFLKMTTATAHSTINAITCCVQCNNSAAPCPTNNTCTSPNQIPFSETTMSSTAESTRPAVYDAYDLVFSYYNYSSIQKINWSTQPMSWLEVKQQIDDCRPFIINVETRPAAGSRAIGDHALVVTGYEQKSPVNPSVNGIFTNDPWKPCCGDQEEAYYPYNVFTRLNSTGITTPEGDSTYFINRVVSTVQSIRPDTLFTAHDNCKSCPFLASTIYPTTAFSSEDTVEALASINTTRGTGIATPAKFSMQNLNTPPEEPKNLSDLLKQRGRDVIGYKKGTEGNKPFTVDSTAYERILRLEPTYYDAPVQYLSAQRINRSYFLACLFPPRKLSKVVLSGYEVIDVVSGKVDTNLVSTFQRVPGGPWELRKIATYTSIDSAIQVSFNNSNLTARLSNARANTVAKKYTLIKYFPEQYEFFSFKIDSTDRTTYLVPAENYPELELGKHIAYREQQVIRTLRRDTRELDRIIRRFLRRERATEGEIQEAPTEVIN